MNAANVIAALTGRDIASVSAFGRNRYNVKLTDGQIVVAKRHNEISAALAEVTSLRWLTEVRVPAVLGSGDGWVIMERVEEDRPTERAAEEFGRDLAGMHQAGAPAFGAPPPGGQVDAWIGNAEMRNVPGETWPRWYAEHRIQPYLRRAVDVGFFDASDAAVLDDLCEHLEDVAGPPEPPARLHGDLWSGNVLWAGDGVWLIDPAAHGGHRETDLAMLALFGCPHLERILGAYQEVAPLAPGWRERIPLHQLFPLLVHTVLFGTGYARSAVAAAVSASRGGRRRR
jgi:fructosamine-3-kinase